MTAGVFLGAGFLHLLPEAVETFRKVHVDESSYPWMYLCAAVGCSLVWFVDMMNMGSSEKMMAIAAAATPDGGASMCRVRIPSIATYGFRTGSRSRNRRRPRSLSDSPLNNNEKRTSADNPLYGSCDCIVPESPSHQLLSRISHAGGSKVFHLNQHSSQTFSIDDLLERRDAEDDDLLDVTHSHVESAKSRHVVFSGANPVLPFLLAALFSIHSLIAGFALGVNPSLNRTAIATYVAILSHKFIEAMSVGANFAKENVKLSRSVAVILLYSIMTPLGIVLGMVLTTWLKGRNVLIAESVAMAIGAGSFIYLAYHEMSDDNDEHEPLDKILLFSIGLASTAALAYWL